MNDEPFPARIGPYRIDGLLGQGGMGSVFRAFHERLDRPVALKRISDPQRQNSRARQRFVREAQAAARLSHPAIVQIYDIFAFKGEDWIVMELVEGRDLQKQIRTTPMTWNRLLPIAHQITSGLAAAHAANLVHRDLKTENVLVTQDDRAKILDFGLAKDLDRRQDDDSTLTRNDHVIGTPRAMSPEQIMGRDVDPRSDLFSFGTLLYEALTGRSPFRAPTIAGTLVNVCSHLPPPLKDCVADIPSVLSTLVERLLEKNPEHRPKDASEVLEHLVAAMSEDAAQASQPAMPQGSKPLSAPPSVTSDISQQTTLALQENPERRQVTLLCCDVRWSDLEESYETLPRLRSAMHDLAKPLGGHVPEVHRDTPVIVFGFPKSHEDDGRRAAQMADVLLQETWDPAPFFELDASKIRFGIHTGPVIVQTDEGRAVLHLGSTLDRALAVARLADDSRLAVSREAWPLVAHRFESVAIVEEALPGDTELIVHRLRSGSDRPKPSASTHLCLGRDHELSLLLKRWEQAQEGRSQIVHVYGEAGIGKTCLIDSMKQALPTQAPQWILLEGKEDAAHSPFFPLASLIQHILPFDDNLQADMDEGSALASLLDGMGLPGQDLLPLLAIPLGLPRDAPVPISGPPEIVKQQTLDALSQLLIAIARRRPMICVVEDLHWFDPSSLEFLEVLIQKQRDVPLLLVLTFRAHFTPPWNVPEALQLQLRYLPREVSRQLIGRLCDDQRLPETIVEQIVERSDGVPLFLEQVTRMALETGPVSLLQSHTPNPVSSPHKSPVVLQQSLTARLDRLGSAKTVAQLASVVGHDFSFELLRNIASMDTMQLQSCLQRLTSAGILRRRGLGQRARFGFRHALIRDVVYESVLIRDRRRIHGHIAELMRDVFGGRPESREENLAWHFTRAGQHEEASQRWAVAGLTALEDFHVQEALQHFRSGLAAVRKMIPGEARDRRELDLLTHLASHLRLVDGSAAAETVAAYDRVLELSQRLDVLPHRIRILWGSWAFHMTSGKTKLALEIADRMVERVDLSSPPDDYMRSYQAQGVAFLGLGQLRRAKKCLETSVARASDPSILEAGYEGHIHAYASLGINLWLLGFPDSGRRAAQQGIGFCQTYPSIHLPLCLLFGAWVEYFRRDASRVKALTCQGLRLTEAQKASYLHPHLIQLLGLAEAMDSMPVTQPEIAAEPWGLARAETAHQELRERSEETVDLTRIAACLCEAHLEQGSDVLAQRRLEEGRDTLEATGEVYLAAELDRLEAELWMHREGSSTRAEELLHRAISTARQQSAKSLELRACLSLAKLLQEQGHRREAKQRVAEIFEDFDEGFSTGDLKHAAEWIGAS